jgi:hypothetical protein
MKTPNQRSFRIISLGAIVSIFLVGVGPIEGRVFPVADQYVITGEKLEGPDLNLSLNFTKERECRFDSVDWYVYFDEISKDRFNIRSRSPKFTRPLGNFSVNWVIEGAGALSGHKMEVVTEHHCWGSLLWTTRTVNDVSRNLEASQ